MARVIDRIIYNFNAIAMCPINSILPLVFTRAYDLLQVQRETPLNRFTIRGEDAARSYVSRMSAITLPAKRTLKLTISPLGQHG